MATLITAGIKPPTDADMGWLVRLAKSRRINDVTLVTTIRGGWPSRPAIGILRLVCKGERSQSSNGESIGKHRSVLDGN